MKGIEPSSDSSQVSQSESTPELGSEAYTQIRAQIPDASGRDLAQVVAAWSGLSSPLKAGILAIVRSCAVEGIADRETELSAGVSAPRQRPARPKGDKRSAETVSPRAQGFQGTRRRAAPD